MQLNSLPHTATDPSSYSNEGKMEHVLTVTVVAHPSGRQFAPHPITFYIPSLQLASNKADELNSTLHKSLGVTEDPPIYIRLSTPAGDQDGCCEYAAMSAGSAMDWLLSTANEQRKDGPSWQDGRPALWVRLPALVPPEPTAAATAAARPTPTNSAAGSSSGQHSTSTGESLNQHGGKQVAVGDAEVVCHGLEGQLMRLAVCIRHQVLYRLLCSMQLCC